MKKKFSVFYFILGFLICFNIILSINIKPNAFADKDINEINSKAKSAILMDAYSGEVVYSKNEKAKLPIASMTKIMTMLICFENISSGNLSFDEEITVSKNASSMGGSQVFLEENGKYKVFELIKSISVASANDSCVALAERLYGSEIEFVSIMNKKCEELGLTNTKFANCTGLPKPDHYSCALDVAKMFKELIKYTDYFKFSSIWMEDFKHPQGRVTQMANTNKLIRFYKGCDCGKTGFTSEAGHCLTASAIRNGLRLIAVEIHAPDSKTRFKDVSDMFNYGFANYVNKLIIDDRKPLDINVKVSKGKKDNLSVKAENPIFLFSKRNEKRSVEISFNPNEKIIAPIKIGDKVGTITIFENGVEIASVNVLSLENIAKKSYFDYISNISKNWGIA